MRAFQKFSISALLVIFSLCITHAFENIELTAPPIVKTPLIRKDLVSYDIDFQFNACPEEYVLYYDHNQRKMAIDFYQVGVSWADSAKKNSFSGEITVRNIETAMSLSGQKGQILFTLQKGWNFEQGWHYEGVIVPPKTLRVKLWFQLHPAVKVKKNQDVNSNVDSKK
jgi:hypothetical protein